MRTTSTLTMFCLALALSACGSSEQSAPAASSSAAAPQPPAATAEPAAPAATADAAAPAAAPASASGESVFKKTCSMCHQSGAAGAPIVGDKADWGPRIAQGKEVLYKHALEGFTGNKGMMPSRGANPALTDDEVKAAVDYMASKAE